MARYDLSETEWRLIAPLLPNKPRGVGRVDDRRVLNGIFYVLRTGSPWRDLPERYGPYTTVYNRYNRWAKAGVWLRVFEALAASSRNRFTSSTAPSFGPISMRPAVKRGPGSRHWPFSWRTEHQDPRRGRRGRVAVAARDQPGAGLRQDDRPNPVGRPASRTSARRRSRL
jgi:transposase